MFRITASYDDAHHPLHGDVFTVASASEAYAAALEGCDPDDYTTELLADMAIGESGVWIGFQVEYTVERVA